MEITYQDNSNKKKIGDKERGKKEERNGRREGKREDIEKGRKNKNILLFSDLDHCPNSHNTT